MSVLSLCWLNITKHRHRKRKIITIDFSNSSLIPLQTELNRIYFILLFSFLFFSFFVRKGEEKQINIRDISRNYVGSFLVYRPLDIPNNTLKHQML